MTHIYQAKPFMYGDLEQYVAGAHSVNKELISTESESKVYRFTVTYYDGSYEELIISERYGMNDYYKEPAYKKFDVKDQLLEKRNYVLGWIHHVLDKPACVVYEYDNDGKVFRTRTRYISFGKFHREFGPAEIVEHIYNGIESFRVFNGEDEVTSYFIGIELDSDAFAFQWEMICK